MLVPSASESDMAKKSNSDLSKRIRREKRGKLRVCILLPRLNIGGAEVQVLHLLKNLDKSSFTVFLCCMQPGDGMMENEAQEQVEFMFRLQFRWRNFPITFIRLVSFLRRYRIDILHCHLGLAATIGRLAGWFAGVPVIMTTEHGKHLWKSWPHLLLERMLVRFTDMRICVSRDIMDLRIRREGTPREKLVLIPNAVELSDFSRPGRGRAAVMAEFGWHVEDPLVISIGRLVAEKNYTLLVESILIVQHDVPSVRCLVVGEGPRRESIEERIAAHGLGSNFSLAGYRRDISDLIAAADVFVLSSIREGLPVSLLEAMAAGKGIAATNVGGIPDAITDGVSGLLVSPDNPEALAGAIGRLLHDTELRRTLGAAAAGEVNERFNVKNTAARIAGIYRTLFNEKTGHGK
jgi:glycosyltransferase involved in cell wall biosynthesis